MLAWPTLITSDPAIASDTLVALGLLCCSAAQVVCIPHAWAISDLYSQISCPCLLGSGMSLVRLFGLAVLVITVSERN